MAGQQQPDVAACRSSSATTMLPDRRRAAAGYGGIWHGQKGFNGVAILARGERRELRRVGLPGDPDDTHSRYIEAEVNGVIVGSLYLPNGNPVGTEKFDYKLALDGTPPRPRRRAARGGAAGGAAGDWNVVPEDRDVFSARAIAKDAVMQPEAGSGGGGSPSGLDRRPSRPHPEETSSTPSGIIPPAAGSAISASASTTFCCSPEAADRLTTPASTAGRAARRKRATTRRPGWSWPFKVCHCRRRTCSLGARGAEVGH